MTYNYAGGLPPGMTRSNKMKHIWNERRVKEITQLLKESGLPHYNYKLRELLWYDRGVVTFDTLKVMLPVIKKLGLSTVVNFMHAFKAEDHTYCLVCDKGYYNGMLQKYNQNKHLKENK